jgi:hypothetical protein
LRRSSLVGCLRDCFAQDARNDALEFLSSALREAISAFQMGIASQTTLLRNSRQVQVAVSSATGSARERSLHGVEFPHTDMPVAGMGV